jgi:hypothetical protein
VVAPSGLWPSCFRCKRLPSKILDNATLTFSHSPSQISRCVTVLPRSESDAVSKSLEVS